MGRLQHMQPDQLSYIQIVAYGSLMLPLAMGFSILIMFIPTYYGMNLRLGLGLVGAVIAAGRVFDFISDPIIGNLSDRTGGSLGARKPWIICGLVLFIFATYGLFVPPESPTILYVFIAASIYFLAFTLVDIPLSAMGLEMSKNMHERTLLAGSKLVCFVIGGIIGALIPTIYSSNLPQALSYVVVAIAITTLIALPCFILVMPTTPPSEAPKRRLSLSTFYQPYKNFFYHKNTRRIIGVFFLVMLCRSLSGSLALLYLTYILIAPELIGPVWILNGLGLFCGVPAWYVLSKKLGKVRVWRLGILVSICLAIPLLTLGEGDNVLMMVLAFGFGVSGTSEVMMPTSLLADHIANEKAKREDVHPAALAALKNAMSKLSVIAPLAIAFPILGTIGLSNLTAETGNIAKVSTFQSATLICCYAVIPLILRCIAFIIMPRLWHEQASLSFGLIRD